MGCIGMIPLLGVDIIDTGGREIHAEVGEDELIVGGFDVVAVVGVDALSVLEVNWDGGCKSGWDRGRDWDGDVCFDENLGLGGDMQ